MSEDIHRKVASVVFGKPEHMITEEEREQGKLINYQLAYVYEGIDKVLNIHAHSMAAHCECLAMNAENSLACCENRTIPYSDAHYWEAMRKWGLIDNEGKPLI